LKVMLQPQFAAGICKCFCTPSFMSRIKLVLQARPSQNVSAISPRQRCQPFRNCRPVQRASGERWFEEPSPSSNWERGAAWSGGAAVRRAPEWGHTQDDALWARRWPQRGAPSRLAGPCRAGRVPGRQKQLWPAVPGCGSDQLCMWRHTGRAKDELLLSSAKCVFHFFHMDVTVHFLFLFVKALFWCEMLLASSFCDTTRELFASTGDISKRAMLKLMLECK